MARITGLATGLDIDSIITQTMQAYRTKIDTQQQQKDILEIKQKLYRDVITDAQKLYNSQFDILKSGSLLSSKTWQSVKFTSSNESIVTVTGNALAKTGNYTVGGNRAKAASVTLSDLEETITINGKEFKVEGSTNKEKATNLNTALSNAGLNISVRYTEFKNPEGKNGFVFESKILGENNNFTIGGIISPKVTSNGKDATSATITGLTVSELKARAKGEDGNEKTTLTIGDKEATIDIAEKSVNSDIEILLNKALDGYTATIADDGAITLKTKATGANQSNPIIKFGEDIIVTAFEDGKNAEKAERILLDLDSLSGSVVINGVNIDLSGITDEEKDINEILENNNSSVSLVESNGLYYLESNLTGASSKIEYSTLTKGQVSTGGKNANITITDSKERIFTYEGISNSINIDGMTFNINADIGTKPVDITSTVDASEIVDKVKSYIEDYNALIVKINTLTSEKRDRSYQPLTADQKKEMSETEIQLWEVKVKQGQLKGDSDLTRIANSLKQGMRSLVSGAGLTLSDIGIESVQDYGGVKDGTFKINEDTLKKAIEEDTEGVMKLFMQSPPSDASENDKYNQSGIMNRLKDILYKESITSKASLIQKAGFEGTITVANNTLTKAMSDYTKKISEMEKIFLRKEQALYSQYAKLETLMNSYSSQMSYLSQSLGISTS